MIYILAVIIIFGGIFAFTKYKSSTTIGKLPSEITLMQLASNIMKMIIKIILALVALYLVIGIIYAVKELRSDDSTTIKDFILTTVTWPLWVTVDTAIKDLPADDR